MVRMCPFAHLCLSLLLFIVIRVIFLTVTVVINFSDWCTMVTSTTVNLFNTEVNDILVGRLSPIQQVNRFVEDGSASFHSEKLGEE